MAGIIFERAMSPGHITEDLANPTAQVLYGVFGTDDPVEVDALCLANIPTYYFNRAALNYVKRNKGAGNWDIEVNYGQALPKVSFETTGGNYKRTNSIKTVATYALPGGGAVNWKGAIGGSIHGVEGVEVVTPIFNWSPTYYLPASLVTPAYIQTLYTLTGRVNNATFKGLPAGEVLFQGATGGQQGNGQVEMTFKFAGSPNLTGIPIFGIGTAQVKDAVAFSFGDKVYTNPGTGHATNTDGGPKYPTLGTAVEFIANTGQLWQVGIAPAAQFYAETGVGRTLFGVASSNFVPGQTVYNNSGTGFPTNGGPTNAFTGRASAPALVGDANVTVSNVNKKGWEYLWIAYIQSTDTVIGAYVQVPNAVYIEQIYEEADFSLLGIGV